MSGEYNKARTVTVIVPVYADWESLADCIESLKKHVEARHKVMLVNDNGPEADSLEENIKRSVKGLQNFEYHRNQENLGFVQNCNRAVLELDNTQNDILLLNSDTRVTEGFLEEMLDVLYLSSKHGTVSPRSNNASLSTVPFSYMEYGGVERDESYAIFNRIKNNLPRLSIAPVSPGFCILIKRSLIERFGLFDEAYGKGYGEENDFCMRINQHGYSSILSNHAYVFHLEARSFTKEHKLKMVDANGAILLKRYPHYKKIVTKYIRNEVDAIDKFADVITGYAKPRLLIDLYGIDRCREADVITDYLKETEAIYGELSKSCDIELLVEEGFYADRLSAIPEDAFITPQTIKGNYNVAYKPFEALRPENLFLLNRYCAKIVITIQTTDFIRNYSRQEGNIQYNHVAYDVLKLADAIFIANKETLDDLEAIYGYATISSLSESSYLKSDKGTVAVIQDILNREYDLQHLRERWSYFVHLAEYYPEGWSMPFKRALKSYAIYLIGKNQHIDSFVRRTYSLLLRK